MADQHLIGTEQDDILTGGTGNDTLEGLGGNDTLDGGAGDDTLIGGLGSDTYFFDYTSGNDTLFETQSNPGDADTLVFGSFLQPSDLVVTRQGNDLRIGVVWAPSSVTFSGWFDPAVSSHVENFVFQSGFPTLTDRDIEAMLPITGTAGDDNLVGTAGNDMILGLEGNDTLDGAGGADTLIGGTGDDTYIVDPADTITELFGEGTDTVESAVAYRLLANVENLVLTGTADISGTGNGLDNSIIGNGGANLLQGGAGNDTLSGGAGNDTLDGGTGDDSMSGGTGDDTYFVDSASDTVVENANEGVDTVQSAMTYTLGANVENLILTPALLPSIDGTGNELANRIVGNTFNNVLDGGAGADTLIGGRGDDTYVVDDVGDVVVENLNEGTDTVRSSITYVLSSEIENLTLTGGNAIDGTGNGRSNILVGNAASNALRGEFGFDILEGSGGDDSLYGGFGTDIARYSGSSGGYAFSVSDDRVRVTDIDAANGDEGVDTLDGIETVRFAGGDFTLSTDIHVSTSTLLNQNIPSIAALEGGGYIVVWQGLGRDDDFGIFAQRYSTDGAPVGVETRINSTTADLQQVPSVSALAGGGYVVAWQSQNQDGSLSGIYAQRFGSDGTPAGVETRANTFTARDQANPAVVGLAGGGYVVSWDSNGQDGSGLGVYLQHYDANGVPAGGEVRANSTVLGDESGPAIGALNNGGYVVAWTGPNAGTSGVYLQRYDGAGNAVGAETLVNTAPFSQAGPSVTGLADGGFVVTWNGLTGSATQFDIYARRYDAAGAPVGGVFLVNATTADQQLGPTVAGLSDGGFVISWNSNNADGDVGGIFAQRYAADGSTLGGEVQINTVTQGSQSSPVVAGLSDGGYTVAWQSDDGSSFGIYARRFDASGAAKVDQMEVRGTSGNDVLNAAGGDRAITLIGGAGNDTYGVDNSADGVTELSNGGVDTVQSSATYALGANVENLLLTGTAAIDGTGNDLANVISGNSADNTLNGGGGNDTLEGGAGNDTLIGGAGDDVYLVNAGGGQDTISDFAGFDELRFGAGVNPDQVSRLRSADDLILQVDPFNSVTIANWFSDPSNQVEKVSFADGTQWDAATTGSLRLLGDENDNFLLGNPSDPQLIEGFGGNDFLFGGFGNDTLDGGTGNDTLQGAFGDDLYLVGADGGQDTISDFAGFDELRFGAGVSPDQVSRLRSADDLILQVDPFNSVTITNWFSDPSNQVEQVSFADGTLWDAATTGSLRLLGDENDNFLLGNPSDPQLIEGFGGNDFLFGGFGNDTLDGGTGNDTLQGAFGDDLYLVGADGGQDTISDFAGFDELRFGSGVNPDQVSRLRNLDDLVLQVPGTSDSVTIANWFTDPSNQVEKVSFADGTQWDAATTGSLRLLGDENDNFLLGNPTDPQLIEGFGGNDQLISGFGNDTLDGGTGNDRLMGGFGDDLYLVDAGGGQDTISDFAGFDELRFGAGVSPDQISRLRSNDDLILQVDPFNSVTIANWFSDPSNQVEQVSFADGTLWDAATTGSLRLLGDENDNFLLGNPTDPQLIEGFGGNDQLISGFGNDTLDGGTGNDTLMGGFGDDLYLVGADGGQDTISDFAGFDELRFGAGVSPDQVSRLRSADDLILQVDPFNSVTIANWFTDPSNQVEKVSFADGTLWDAATTGSLRLLGDENDNFLLGNPTDPQLIEGFGGNDQLFGGFGNDTLDGGAGFDRLTGGPGDDTYLFGFGSGFDIVGEGNFFAPAGFDVVRFAPDVTQADVQTLTDGNGGLVFSLAGGPDQLDLGDWTNFDVLDVVDEVDFADGGTIGLFRGTGQDDVLAGTAGRDVLFGGAGFDTLIGGAGDDAYIYNADSGVDTIQDVADASGGNRLVFGYFFDFDQLQLSYGDGNLLLNLPGTGRQVALSGFDNRNVLGQRAVESFVDKDGIVRSYEDLVARGFDIFAAGTGAGETLTGTNLQDRIHGGDQDDVLWGFEGSDALFGGGGNDILYGDLGATGDSGYDFLVGGTGDDSLYGGKGGDTYLFDRLSGHDTVFESEVDPNDVGDKDFAVFGPGIVRQDLVVTRQGNDLRVDVSGSSASVTFNAWFDPAVSSHVETFILQQDGSVFTDQQIEAMINHAPIANLDAVGVAEDATTANLVPLLLSNDSGDALSIASVDTAGTVGSVAFDAANQTLAYSANAAPQDALAAGQTATDSFGYTVVDSHGATSTASVTVTVTGVNDAPVLATPLADQTAAENNPFTFQVPGSTFTDVDMGDTLSYSATLGNGSALPSWLSFNAANQTFTGIPGHGDIGTASVKVVATDTHGASASDIFGINTVRTVFNGTAGADTLTGSAFNDTLSGLGGNDVLSGGAGNDTLDGGAGRDTMTGGTGDDTYGVSVATDVVNENPGEGNDTVQSAVTLTLGANVENLVLTGSSSINGTGNALNNLVRGNSANNTLNGADGFDALEGGAGNDALNDTSGGNYYNGGAGTDTLTGGASGDFFIGGTGNDTVNSGNGADVIAFNVGDGQDKVNPSSGVDNIVSLGGAGLDYANLTFQKSGSNLILNVSAADKITFSNWYSGSANRDVLDLQVVAEAMAAFNPSGANPLLDDKLENFNFQGLVGAFDAARAANPTLTTWALTNALTQFQLAGSDTAALGGDLAYYYGLNGTVAGIGFDKAQDVVTGTGFGTQAQTLRPLASLQDGVAPLG